MRWPGREPYDGGWEQFWPTWDEFWDRAIDLEADVAPPAPIDGFLESIRRGAPDELSVRVR